MACGKSLGIRSEPPCVVFYMGEPGGRFDDAPLRRLLHWFTRTMSVAVPEAG